MKKVTITLLTMISIFGIVVMGFLYQIRLRDAKIEDLKRERLLNLIPSKSYV